jgi:hypothetical protein
MAAFVQSAAAVLAIGGEVFAIDSTPGKSDFLVSRDFRT